MGTKWTLTVAGDFHNLEQVARFVRRAASEIGMGETGADDVEMAVDEAVSNAIEHSYEGQARGRIDITCFSKGGEMVVEVRDYGMPFDPDSVKSPQTQGPLSERSVGGLGLFFMRRLMDRVEFRSRGKRGNLVVMAKRIPR